MSINIDDNLLGVWYVQLSPSADFMGALSKTGDGRFQFTSRFRYYADDKAFNSQDRKNWHQSVTAPGATEQLTLKVVRQSVQILIDRSGGEHYELLRGTMNTDEFVKEFMKLPFVHVQAVGFQPAQALQA